MSVTPVTTSAKAVSVNVAAEFTATDEIPAGGTIELTAPAGSSFSADRTNYIIFDLTDGGNAAPAQVTVGPNGAGDNVVDITSYDVPAGDQLKLVMHGFAHPDAANASGTFSVSTSADTTAGSVAYPITAPTSVSNVSASENVTAANPRCGYTSATPVAGRGWSQRRCAASTRRVW